MELLPYDFRVDQANRAIDDFLVNARRFAARTKRVFSATRQVLEALPKDERAGRALASSMTVDEHIEFIVDLSKTLREQTAVAEEDIRDSIRELRELR